MSGCVTDTPEAATAFGDDIAYRGRTGLVLMRHPRGGTGLSFQKIEGYERPTWPEEPDRQQKMIHLDVQITPPGGDDDGGYSE